MFTFLTSCLLLNYVPLMYILLLLKCEIFLGIVNLGFKLPEYPQLGNWTIKVQARQQVQNHTILVEHNFKPKFEVKVFCIWEKHSFLLLAQSG